MLVVAACVGVLFVGAAVFAVVLDSSPASIPADGVVFGVET